MSKTFTLVWFAVIALFASACSPGETRTPLPPTPDVKAIETRVAKSIFATMTASAPTATNTVTATRTFTQTPIGTPTKTPTVTRTVSKSQSPTPNKVGTPVPTVNPLVNQIPKGKGAIIVTNYISGRQALIEIKGKTYTADYNQSTLIVLDPGTYTFSAQIPNVRGGRWNDEITITADRYYEYPLYLVFQ